MRAGGIQQYCCKREGRGYVHFCAALYCTTYAQYVHTVPARMSHAIHVLMHIFLLMHSMCLLVNLFVAFLCTVVPRSAGRISVVLVIFQLCFLVLHMYPDLLILQEAN